MFPGELKEEKKRKGSKGVGMWDRETKEARVGVPASDAVWAWLHGQILDPVALTCGAVPIWERGSWDLYM